MGKAAEDYEDPWFPLSHPPTEDAPALDMSITVAHNCAAQYGITREAQDEWALRSHQRAVKAIDAGSFVEEIVPIAVPQADGSTITFSEDEHPRRSTTLETLAGLKVPQEILMTDASAKVIARPSAPDHSADGFNACTYTASCAAPTGS